MLSATRLEWLQHLADGCNKTIRLIGFRRYGLNGQKVVIEGDAEDPTNNLVGDFLSYHKGEKTEPIGEITKEALKLYVDHQLNKQSASQRKSGTPVRHYKR